MNYKVQVIDISCCNEDINPKDIENAANAMASQGYELVQVYSDSTQACCGSKKSVVMVFRTK